MNTGTAAFPEPGEACFLHERWSPRQAGDIGVLPLCSVFEDQGMKMGVLGRIKVGQMLGELGRPFVSSEHIVAGFPQSQELSEIGVLP